jgi:hypothetical protein
MYRKIILRARGLKCGIRGDNGLDFIVFANSDEPPKSPENAKDPNPQAVPFKSSRRLKKGRREWGG